MSDFPAITGKQLINLLVRDGWQEGRKANHGICLTKHVDERIRVTFIPDSSVSLPSGTLSAIFGSKQTGIRKKKLQELINKYGL
jgi:predicted RNA binding protein YcfA (HicA-like mRNA interferase family)